MPDWISDISFSSPTYLNGRVSISFRTFNDPFCTIGVAGEQRSCDGGYERAHHGDPGNRVDGEMEESHTERRDDGSAGYAVDAGVVRVRGIRDLRQLSQDLGQFSRAEFRRSTGAD